MRISKIKNLNIIQFNNFQKSDIKLIIIKNNQKKTFY